MDKSIDDDLVKTSKTTTKTITSSTTQLNSAATLLDSMPIEDALTCQNLRYISTKPRVTDYNQRTSTSTRTVYNSSLDLIVRNFIKFLITEPSVFPEIRNELKTYDLIIEFIHGFNPYTNTKMRLSKQSISNLKNR